MMMLRSSQENISTLEEGELLPSYFIRYAAMGDVEAINSSISNCSYFVWDEGIDVTDPLGCTALHAAVRVLTTNKTLTSEEILQYESVVTALLSQGADIYKCAQNGKCAWDYLEMLYGKNYLSK